MKKYLLITITIWLWAVNAHSQTKYGSKWAIGYGYCYVNSFNGNTTNVKKIVNTPTSCMLVGGNSNICDSNGNLILICDGINLYDSNLNYIDSGKQLAFNNQYSTSTGSSNDQWSIILPMANNIYYVINDAQSDTAWLNSDMDDYLLYHKVDMNVGTGKVVKRMQILDTGDISSCGLTACRHANGRDWWIIKPAQTKSKFNVYLLTEDSFVKKSEQTFSLPISINGINSNGQIIFNKEGTKLLYIYAAFGNCISIFDFDRCTGTFSNSKFITSLPYSPTNTALVGGCFSPSGRFLYLANFGRIFQYDLQTSDSSTAWYQVAGYDTTGSQFAGYGNIYPAPNGKLYINSSTSEKSLSVINQPDSLHGTCGWCPLCFRIDTIPGSVGYLKAFPNMPNYNLGASSVTCWPEGTSQLDLSNYNIKVFPNPSSGIINVEYKLDKTAEFNVYNLVGQLLYTTTLPVERDKKQINLFNLKTGIYTYQILQNGRVVKTGKLTLAN